MTKKKAELARVAEATHARVTLHGLTLLGRVWKEGDLIPLDELPPYLYAQVMEGEHPYLEPAQGDEEPGEREDEKSAETTEEQ